MHLARLGAWWGLFCDRIQRVSGCDGIQVLLPDE